MNSIVDYLKIFLIDMGEAHEAELFYFAYSSDQLNTIAFLHIQPMDPYKAINYTYTDCCYIFSPQIRTFDLVVFNHSSNKHIGFNLQLISDHLETFHTNYQCVKAHFCC